MKWYARFLFGFFMTLLIFGYIGWEMPELFYLSCAGGAFATVVNWNIKSKKGSKKTK